MSVGEEGSHLSAKASAMAAEIDRAVRDLTARYCEATSEFDVGAWADCWHADARWSIPGKGTLSGIDEILATFTEIRALYTLCVQQLLHGRIAPQEAGGAAARWYVRELQFRERGEAGGELLGVYDDVASPAADGSWRFTSRSFRLLYNGPVEQPGKRYVDRGSPT